jgi:hypothetical protein
MRKNENSFSILNRVGVAVLAAQIMGHDAMFTLLGVYSFGIFFHSYNSFRERGRGGKASY